MEEIVTATPGFAKDENGRYHFQGAHSQSEYVIDGQTISDQTGVTFSNSIDPGIAQSMEMIYGNVPAEYGEKIGAVINLTTKSGLGTGAPRRGFRRRLAIRHLRGRASLGGGSQTFGYFASLNGSWSDRFLDPVNFDNLHNPGDTQRGFLRLDTRRPIRRARSVSPASSAKRTATFRTHSPRRTPARTSRCRADQNYNLGWQSILSQTTFELIAFGRFSNFELTPSPSDTPVTAASDRVARQLRRSRRPRIGPTRTTR